MANLLNPAECSLGFTLKKLLVEYNMKPVLTRPQHRFYTNNATYLEIDVDVHIFGYVARKGLSSLKYACPCGASRRLFSFLSINSAVPLHSSSPMLL